METKLETAQAKLARYESAGRELPEEPEVATMRWHDKQRAVVPQDAYLELQSYLAAQTVRADMWQARCLSLFWRGEADDVTCGKLQEAANKIEAALKEQKT